ncbi:hypothetical protein BC629DRAFT_1587152 [Irpex lacteus]|nr:hypothetical protein BC629DRAFT_1587152 [Irpex lacteus]
MSDDSHRWSQVMPPHTALGFAALWDPEEGMVTFSIGELLDSDTSSSATSEIFPATHSTDNDAQSTLDPFLRSVAMGRDRAQAHQERHPSAHLDWSQVRSVGRTIYTLARAPLERGIFSSNRPNASNRASTPDDEGFFEEMPNTAGTGDFSTPPVLVNLNLKSHFSMTTTSTTGYVDVDTPSTYSYATSLQEISPSEAWSTVHGLDYESYSNRRKPAERGRRLQKPRKYLHVVNPADPAEVLARPMYNHTVQPPPRALPHLTLPHKAAEDTSPTSPLRQCVRKFKSLPKIPRPSPPTVRTHKTSMSSDTRPSTSELPPALPPLPQLPSTNTAIRGVTPPFPRRSTTPLSTYILPSPPLTPPHRPIMRSAPPSAYNPPLTPPPTPPNRPTLRSSPPSAYSSPTPPPFAYAAPSTPSPTPPSPTTRGRPQLRRQRSGLAHAVAEGVARLTSKCRPGKSVNSTTESIRPSMNAADSERPHYGYGYGYRYAV